MEMHSEENDVTLDTTISPAFILDELSTRDIISNETDINDAKHHKELSFTLVLKKKVDEANCVDTSPNYDVKFRSKFNKTYQRRNGCSFTAFEPSIDTSADICPSRKDGDNLVVTESQPQIKPQIGAVDIQVCSDFTPVQLINLDNFKYCSYCFTSNEGIVHENGRCVMENLSGLPSCYWPIGWPKIQSLSYEGVACAVNGCQSEVRDPTELMEHVEACHTIGNDPVLTLDVPSFEEKYKPSEEAQIQKHSFSLTDFASTNILSESTILLNRLIPEESDTEAKTIYQSIKPYKCGLCHSTTPEVKNVMQHYLHSHEVNILYICETCNFVSHLKGSLKKHWSRFHYSKDALPDPKLVIEEPFDESVMMKENPKSLPGASGSTGSSTDSNINFPVHNLENYNDFQRKQLSNFRIRCKLCDYSTNVLDCMRHHIVAKHITMISETLINVMENTSSYRCVTCKATKETKGKIASHYMSEHLETIKFKCEVCDKAVRDIAQFNKHCVTDKHADLYRRSLRCKKCLFATMSKAKLQKHATKHAPTLKCTKCNYETVSKGNFWNHTNHVHSEYSKNKDGLYFCENEDCTFSTRAKDDLFRHMRVEHRK